MNRKLYTGILVAIVCLAFGLLTGCSSSSPTYSITAASGSTPQTQTEGEAFAVALGVNVTSGTTPASGVTVTFAAPSSGQSCALSATTATTDSNGNASVTCTANTTPGAYSVTASVSSTVSTSFALTNEAPSVFVFDVNGLEQPNATNGGFISYYAVAGAVAFDLSGNVLGGVQDYNDGVGTISVSGGDTIGATATSASLLTVDMTTGTGTLVIDVSAVDTNVGVAGVETFALQFANASHAVISQFDGTATSSGSFDLQGTGTAVTNFAFTLSGTDSDYDAVSYGGVFSDTTPGVAAGVISGTVDVNDDGTVTPGAEGVANMTGTDNGTSGVFGRGTASFVINGTTTLTLVYYVVGPEVIRLIDMDTFGTAGAGSAAIGSAYGQGATPAFDSTDLGTADVFGFNGNPWGELYAVAGQVTPVGSAGVPAGTFTGEADLDDDGIAIVSAASTAGTYIINPDGYGSLSITSANLENSTQWGVYATDPTLNLYDPNNTTAGQGGALVMEMSPSGALTAGTGIITPQGATTSSDFNSNSYAFGAQAYAESTLTGWEFDMVGQAPFDTTLDLTGATGSISDPSGVFVADTNGQYTAVPITGTAAGPDTFGRYTYSTALTIGPAVSGGTAIPFTTVMYEANGGFVFWIDEDDFALWLGSLEEQSSSSLAKSHFKKGVISKAQTKMKRR